MKKDKTYIGNNLYYYKIFSQGGLDYGNRKKIRCG